MSPWIRLLRPKQWIKNGFVFAAAVLCRQIPECACVETDAGSGPVLLFIACVVYIVNDIRDVAEDRKHPLKKNRPLAAGELKPMQAVLLPAFSPPPPNLS